MRLAVYQRSVVDTVGPTQVTRFGIASVPDAGFLEQLLARRDLASPEAMRENGSLR